VSIRPDFFDKIYVSCADGALLEIDLSDEEIGLSGRKEMHSKGIVKTIF